MPGSKAKLYVFVPVYKRERDNANIYLDIFFFFLVKPQPLHNVILRKHD